MWTFLLEMHTHIYGIAGHMITLCSSLQGTPILFSNIAASFYGVSSFSISSQTPVIVFFIFALLVCVELYLTVDLICIFQMIDDIEHLFICILAIHLFVFFGAILFKSLVHFLIVLFVLLLLSFKNYLCILDTRPLSEIGFKKFSLILWVVFLLC